MRIAATTFAALLLAGCGSMKGAGPFYEQLVATCTAAGVSAPCTSDSPSLAFAREKVTRHAQHFTDMAEKRSDVSFTAGNVGIGASLIGVIAATAQSREGVIASALVGVPTALFAQRYNLSGQGVIYLRGVRNFQCMRAALREVQDFQSLYDRLPPAERGPELTTARLAFVGVPAAADRRVDDVVMRTRGDLVSGVAVIDTAMITAALERYVGDLKAAQDRINFGTLYKAPPPGVPPAVAAGVVPLTEDEKAQLKAIAVKLVAMPAALDQCATL